MDDRGLFAPCSNQAAHVAGRIQVLLHFETTGNPMFACIEEML
jgi:hypothetical protein